MTGKKRQRSTNIPQGIIINETNVCAQYDCPTGAVPSKINPTVKANNAIIIITLPETRLKMNAVVRAAQNPLIVIGIN